METRTSYRVVGTTSAEVHMLPDAVGSNSDILLSKEVEGASHIMMPISRIENSFECLERGEHEQSSMNLRHVGVTEGD